MRNRPNAKTSDGAKPYQPHQGHAARGPYFCIDLHGAALRDLEAVRSSVDPRLN
jgi:hypothetical protein